MNYLAHLHLAPDNPAARVGNLLGDFLAIPGRAPALLQQGMPCTGRSTAIPTATRW
jgi:acyl carrier protein phosphodiesterase